MPASPQADFDERLADALNSALYAGEEIVACEAGDHGQAIALTGRQIIMARVGLAATGELEGHRVTTFPLADVAAINLRKGGLGAVIQVVANQTSTEASSGAPDNVIVFTGPGRVKKAEAFAEAVESITGMTVTRVGPHSQPDRHASPQPDARQEVAEAPAQAEPQPQVPEEEDQPALTAREEYRPNPRLPKPIRKRRRGPSKMLVALGVLAGLTVVGMAVMAPVREAQLAPMPTVTPSTPSISQRSVRLQLQAVANYEKQVSEAMLHARAEVSALRTAIASQSRTAVQNACRPGRIDVAWQTIAALSPPPGLVEANQNLLDGLLRIKNAAAAASVTLESKEALARLDEAESLISKGRSAIAAQRSSLEKQAAALHKQMK